MNHVQGELPLAVVEGSPLTQLPEDLYIPPDALEIILDCSHWNNYRMPKI